MRKPVMDKSGGDLQGRVYIWGVLTWQFIESFPASKVIEVVFVRGSCEFYRLKKGSDQECGPFQWAFLSLILFPIFPFLSPGSEPLPHEIREMRYWWWWWQWWLFYVSVSQHTNNSISMRAQLVQNWCAFSNTFCLVPNKILVLWQDIS